MSRLREARIAAGWSQAQLIDELVCRANAYGIKIASPASLKTLISRWENGHATPDPPYRSLLQVVLSTDSSALGFTSDDLLTSALTAPHPADESEKTMVAVYVDGKVKHVFLDRRTLIAAGLGAVLGLPKARGTAAGVSGGAVPRTEPGNQARSLVNSLQRKWRGLRIVARADQTSEFLVKLPGVESFPGVVLPMVVESPGQRLDNHLVVKHSTGNNSGVSSFPSSAGLYVTTPPEDPEQCFVLSSRSAAQQLRSDPKVLAFPDAHRFDDLTFGILWAAANLDQPLLDDDSILHRRRRGSLLRGANVAPELADDLAADLSPASRMWMGSESCARFIVDQLGSLNQAPQFWTREQKGQEACTWLFFAHKYEYLQEAYKRLSTGQQVMSRSFCIPEDSVRQSATWERILLFLSVALMESFRITVFICADPRYSDIDGVVLAPGSRAIVANWVRAGNAWSTKVTTSPHVLRGYRDNIGDSIQLSVNAGHDARERLQSLAAYLGLGWHQLGKRCEQLRDSRLSGIYDLRSHLISFAGLDRSLKFVAAAHGHHL